jgi:translation initiation factor IF-1
MFRVEIDPSKQIILATVSGKIRKNFVRILVGDSVICEVSAYDLTRGRITYRNK